MSTEITPLGLAESQPQNYDGVTTGAHVIADVTIPGRRYRVSSKVRNDTWGDDVIRPAVVRRRWRPLGVVLWALAIHDGVLAVVTLALFGERSAVAIAFTTLAFLQLMLLALYVLGARPYPQPWSD